MAHSEEDGAPHQTSLAVWDLSSPLVVNRSATMKVGAKCSAGCAMTNHEVEIHDGAGQTVARASLGTTAWPGTSGLYWTEVDFSAPQATGTHTWSVTSAHGNACSNFTFIAVEPPDHSLTIRIREKGAQAPLVDVEIRLGVYRASSDSDGLASIELPRGNHTLSVFKPGFEPFSAALDVTQDVTVEVELGVESEPRQPYWMG
jgi:hypothetical protein